MNIEVWSDVVCPWCFIGKRRLESAIERLKAHSPEVEITVRHRAFRLQPEIVGLSKTSENLAKKYGVGPEQVALMQENVRKIAEGEGLHYDLADTLDGNTMDAHRLLLCSATIGRQSELMEAMFSAYFEKNQPLFSHEDLMAITDQLGIDRIFVRGILESDDHANEVIEDQEMAYRLGASGVPFFVIDMKFGISGAAPAENFDAVLMQALESQEV